MTLDAREGRRTVRSEDARRTARSEDAVGSPARAPTGVPDRITAVAPIPSGFEPAGTFERSEDGRRGITVTGRLLGVDPVVLVDDLEVAMNADGWEQISRSNINDELLSLHLERDEETFNVNVIAHGDEARLTLMLLEGSD
jgi:hypothetical protein